MNILRYTASRNVGRQLELLGLVLASGALGIAPIWLFRYVLDRAVAQRDTSVLARVAAALVAVVAMSAVVNFRQTIVSERILVSFVADLRRELIDHLMRASPQFLAKSSVGEITSRIIQDVSRLGLSLIWVFLDPIVHSIGFVLYFGYLLSIDVRMTLLAVALLPLLLPFIPRLNRAISKYAKAYGDQSASYSGRLNETFSSVFEIQNHATFAFELARLEKTQTALSESQVGEQRSKGMLMMLAEVNRGLGPLVVTVYGATLAILGKMSIGNVVAFSAALESLYPSLDKLIKYPPLLRYAQERFDELRAYLDAPQTSADPADVTRLPSERSGVVVLDSVTFHYDPERPAVNDLTLKVGAGEHVALVGRSGCGKSTVLSLVSGRVRHETGEISLDGASVRSLETVDRSLAIGFVGQQPVLFAGSLRMNLVYGLLSKPVGDPEHPDTFVSAPEEDFTPARLVATCRAVGLGDEVFQFGLLRRVGAGDGASLLPVRARVRSALADAPGLVVSFDGAAVLEGATVGENLAGALVDAGHGVSDDEVAAWCAAVRKIPALSLVCARAGWVEATRDLEFFVRIGEKNPELLRQLGLDRAAVAARAQLVTRVGDRPRTPDALGDEAFDALVRIGLRATVDDRDAGAELVAHRSAFAAALGRPERAVSDPSLWYDDLTVMENLLFGRPASKDAKVAERLLRAVASALAEGGGADDVCAWGLQHEVGERGSRLSGGQRQKVTIARMLLKQRPRVVLLDEPTAALDERSARDIDELVTKAFHGTTTLTVTHRLGHLDRFDRVVVMDQGRVVEDGAPHELLSRDGPLRRLRDAAQGAD